MQTDIQHIRNIGPSCEKMFIAAGIKSAKQIRELGAVETYKLVVEKNHIKGHLMLLYALWTGLEGRRINDISEEEKLTLKKQVGRA